MYWGRIKVIPLGTVTVLEKKTAVVHTARKMRRMETDNTPSTLLEISISWDIVKC
jgi:hypothetical protein